MKMAPGFQPKFDQLAIITSRGTDNVLLTRALIIIHTDMIMFMSQAAKEYCSNSLMQSLIDLTRSTHSHLIRILSTSLLYNICACGVDYIDAFFKMSGPIHLMSMLLARDNTGDEESMNHTLMVHEHAIRLLVLLTRDIKHHHALVNFGLLERVAEICDVFKSDGHHRNCCFDKISFSDEARSITKEFIEGKKLVGKVDETESGGKGNLNMYAVDLYDTTTDEDVNINKKLLKLGHAWPEPLTLPCENQQNTKISDTLWCDFHVTKVIDAHCFWAFIDSDAPSRVSKLASLLEDYVYSSDVCPIDDIETGERVCFSLTKEKNCYQWVRGCVLEIDETARKCHVLVVDYGYGARVDCDQLFPVPDTVKDIPHQANLCVLKGIKAAPSYAFILKYLCEVVTNITQENRRFRNMLHNLGVTKYLLRFCMLPVKEVVIKAVAALINMLDNFNLKAEIGQFGGCKIVSDLILQYSEDNFMLDGLLGMALNLLTECYPNRKLLVDCDCFLLLMKLYRSSTLNSDNKEIVLNIIKNLVGDGWRLLDPVNIPDVRGIIQESIDTMKGSFNLPNLCSDEILEEVKKRRRRRDLRPCEADPTPTYVSLTVDDLIKKLAVSDEDEDSKSEGYKTDTDFEDNYDREHIAMMDCDGYMYGARSNVTEDERHCFMYSLTFQKIKSVDIGNTVCAMLNHGQGGTIYIGITKSGQILGMNISRRERDNLRLGVDDLLGRFTPNVKHDKYEIKCVPVLKGMSANNVTQVEERFVIEVRVAKSSFQYFQTPAKKILFREGITNIELNVQQIRERTVKEEEQKYQSEIKVLRQALEFARKPPPKPQCTIELDLD